MKNAGKIIGVFVVVLLIAVGAFYYFNRPKVVATSAQQPQEITGSIEAQETDVNVKVPGKVESINVEEGQEVAAGDVIATIEAENIKAKVKQAKAVLEAAKAKYQQAQIGYKAQKEQSASAIRQAQAMLDAATAQFSKAKNGARRQQKAQAKDLVDQAREGYELAESTYNRLKQLYDDGVLPEQKLDVAKTERDVAKARYNSAMQQYDMVEEGAQKEDIQAAAALVNQAQAALAMANATRLQVQARLEDMDAARAQMLQAQAAVDEAQSYLDDSTVKAPVAGIITMRSADKGELVSTGMPIVTISDLRDIWVNFKVRETSLAQFKLGETIPVKILGSKGKVYNGRITYIAAKPSFATERAGQEKGEKDIVAFGVKVKLVNDDLQLRPGMTATLKLK